MALLKKERREGESRTVRARVRLCGTLKVPGGCVVVMRVWVGVPDLCPPLGGANRQNPPVPGGVMNVGPAGQSDSGAVVRSGRLCCVHYRTRAISADRNPLVVVRMKGGCECGR